MNGTLRTYARVLSYLSPHRGQLAGYFAVTTLVSLLELLTPWPMKVLVDSVLGSHPLPPVVRVLSTSAFHDKLATVVAIVAAILLLKMAMSLLKIYGSRISILVRQQVVLGVKSELFNHLQKQSFTFYDTRRIGDLISRVNDDVWGIDEFVVTIMPLVVSVFTLAAMLWIVAYLNSTLLLVAFVVTPFFYASYGFYSKRFDKRVEEIQRLEGESTSIVQEVLSGLRVVKAFTREDHEYGRFVRQGRSAAKARVELTTQQVAYSVIVGVITTAGTSLVLGVGAYQILRGSLTLGELLVILAYLASVYGPLESISTALTYTHAYVAKMKRIFEILDIRPDIQDMPGAQPLPRVAGRVEFESVNFAYPERGLVLRDISFRVDPGQIIGIAGPTGAGKTTLVSLIPRFYEPSTGRILIDGHDIKEVRIRSLREQISVVLQEPILFLGTMRENISYGKPNAGLEEVIEAARLANVHEFITGLPDGYETRIGERGVTLSGGERQRISMARAFLKRAPILILDEPTSSLDYKTEASILEALERLMLGRTTFIIAHRISTLRSTDRILVLREGTIVETGTHEELIRMGGVYSELYTQSLVGSDADKNGVPSVPNGATSPFEAARNRT